MKLKNISLYLCFSIFLLSNIYVSNIYAQDSKPEFTNLYWESDNNEITEASIGQVVGLSFDVSNLENVRTAEINVFEYNEGIENDFVARFTVGARNGTVKTSWTVMFDGNQVNTQCAREREENGWTIPNYIFTVTIDSSVSEASKQISVWDNITAVLEDVRDDGSIEKRAFTDYIIVVAGNETRTGYSDEDGNIFEPHVPVGFSKMTIVGPHVFEEAKPASASPAPDVDLKKNTLYMGGDALKVIAQGRVAAYGDNTYICVEAPQQQSVRIGRLYEYSEFNFAPDVDVDKFVFDDSYEDNDTFQNDIFLYYGQDSTNKPYKDSLINIIDYLGKSIFQDSASGNSFPRLNRATKPKILWFSNSAIFFEMPLYMQTSSTQKTLVAKYFLLDIMPTGGSKISYSMIAVDFKSAPFKADSLRVIEKTETLDKLIFEFENEPSITCSLVQDSKNWTSRSRGFFVYDAGDGELKAKADASDEPKVKVIELGNNTLMFVE
ncbi:MAG: hypothetical protein Ta2G_19860 [Termitinemataceae bacterium]|nr:MAG: hypothetical protein Ta2G_19860 [Termitinemataceae bacterium]